MTITQAVAAKLGKHIYDIFETEMLVKIERRLNQIAKEERITFPEEDPFDCDCEACVRAQKRVVNGNDMPTDEQCAEQKSCLLCGYHSMCDRDFKEQHKNEQILKEI